MKKLCPESIYYSMPTFAHGKKDTIPKVYMLLTEPILSRFYKRRELESSIFVGHTLILFAEFVLVIHVYFLLVHSRLLYNYYFHKLLLTCVLAIYVPGSL